MARGKNFRRGIYTPTNPSKYLGNVDNITYRSSWELHFMKWCDLRESVLFWNSEEIIIPYFSNADQRHRRYMVDFYVKYTTKSGLVKEEIIEIKPLCEVSPPEKKKGKTKARYAEELYTFNVNVNKWEAASNYARKRGWVFRILTEKELFK